MGQINLRGYPRDVQAHAKEMVKHLQKAREEILLAENAEDNLTKEMVEFAKTSAATDEQKKSTCAYIPSAFRLVILLKESLTTHFDENMFRFDEEPGK